MRLATAEDVAELTQVVRRSCSDAEAVSKLGALAGEHLRTWEAELRGQSHEGEAGASRSGQPDDDWAAQG